MSTFHPEIDGQSLDNMIFMATVTKIPRLWICPGHVPVSVCMGVCVCVHTRMYGYQKYVCMFSYGMRMCLCMRVAIR